MTDRPIIFSGPMIRALLDGRKTQTRRVIKDRGDLPAFCGGRYDDKADPSNYGWEDCDRGEWITLDQWPRWDFVPYRGGDRLWVREGHAIAPRLAYRGSIGVGTIQQREHPSDGYSACIFRECFDRSRGSLRWRPSIHMPRWASRITLIVTDVRVQRLQDMSAEDTIAEGVECETCKAMRKSACHHRGCPASKIAFRDLWNSIHGPDAWAANPWVCAISFDVQRGNIDDREAS